MDERNPHTISGGSGRTTTAPDGQGMRSGMQHPGSVEARENAAQALMDATERAPFDRVPPSFPMKRTGKAKYERLTLTIDAGGIATLEYSLGFISRSVELDNYTDRWLYLPFVDKYVPPKNVGRIFSLGGGTQLAKVLQAAPSSRVIGAITAGQIVNTVWYEDDLGENPGILHP